MTTVTFEATDGCNDPVTVTVNVTRPPCAGEAHCTYTQGYYGNPGGKTCSGKTALQIMQSAFDLNNLTQVTFGGTGRSFTLDRSSIISSKEVSTVPVYNRIFALLPAGGTPASLKAGVTSSLDESRKWGTIPRSTKKSNYGKIMNNLLGQTITLFFNRMNDHSLDNYVLDRYIITVESADCGTSNTTVPGDPWYTRFLKASIIT